MTPFANIRVVNIETVSGCNLRCEWCSLSITRKKLRFMELGVLDQILSQFRGMDVLVAPYLGGEPLLHPNFPSVVRQIRAAGFTKIRVHTNGTRMDRELANALVEAGLTTIVFSIDGQDASDFERLRGTPFAPVRDALATYLDAAAGRAEVGVQCMVPVGTPKTLNADLDDLASRLSFQIVEYPHNWVWGGQIAGTVPPDAPQVPCFFLNYYMAFDWQGHILPCCRCLNSEHVLGDIRHEDARSVWDGSLEVMRQAHLRGELVKPCSSCDWYPTSLSKLRVV